MIEIDAGFVCPCGVGDGFVMDNEAGFVWDGGSWPGVVCPCGVGDGFVMDNEGGFVC